MSEQGVKRRVSTEEDDNFNAMLGGEKFKERLDWKLFRQLSTGHKPSNSVKTDILLNPDLAELELSSSRVEKYNARVAARLKKQSSSVTATEYLTSLFDDIASGPRDKTNEYFNHLRYFRRVLKRLIGMKKIDLSKELNSSESQFSLVKRRYGCLSCSYKGTKICPYGIGLLKAEKNEYDKMGQLVTRQGEIMERHPNNICDEKLDEFREKFAAYNQLTGLKDARTESLMQMNDFLKATREKLTDVLEEQKLHENGESGSRGLFVMDKNGDTAIKTALVQLDLMQQRYHEQLNRAITQEEGVKSVVEKRISADDLNNMIKKARSIDITASRRLSGEEQKATNIAGDNKK